MTKKLVRWLVVNVACRKAASFFNYLSSYRPTTLFLWLLDFFLLVAFDPAMAAGVTDHVWEVADLLGE